MKRYWLHDFTLGTGNRFVEFDEEDGSIIISEPTTEPDGEVVGKCYLEFGTLVVELWADQEEPGDTLQ